MRPELILALDIDSIQKAQQLLQIFSGKIKWVKVGSQLFVSEGPDILRLIKGEGFNLFLDLKLHDIPNTVARTVTKMRAFGIDMLTVHIAGGAEMLRAAKHEAGEEVKVIGVTVLTSLDQKELGKMGISRGLEEQVFHLAVLAKECGIDGIVTSARESERVRKDIGRDLIIVTPGIRMPGSKSDDQKRTMTPAESKRLDIDYIVVGRPILEAEKPLRAAEEILRALQNG